MLRINIIVCGKQHTFREPSISLIESLKELGYEIGEVSWYIKNGDKVVLGDINIYLGALITRNVPILDNSLNIYFCTEQCVSNGIQEHINYYQTQVDRFDFVFDMFRKNIVFPKKAKRVYCPVGWSPIWDENYNPSITETIDMLLIGRIQIRNTIRKGIKERVKSVIAYGSQRDNLIQQTKINLSLQTFSNGYEWTQYRMLYVLGKRKFLMGDEHIDYGPYEPDKHFIVFKGDDITDCYNEWIDKPKRRQEFAINAYEDIKKNHKFSMYLEKSLKGII